MLDIKRIRRRVEVLFEVDGVKILDSETAKLLKLIDKYNSIYLASKALGLAYSRAWEKLSKMERILGLKIVEKKRGGLKGGGTRLTEDGKKLLGLYEETLKELNLTFEILEKPRIKPQLLIVGSHDILLELFIGYFKKKYGASIETSWIGSSGGLAALMLNEADIATTHLYDPASRQYNKPFLKNYWLEDKVEVIKGYFREQVFAYHPSLSFSNIEEILEMLINGKLVLINRNLGSGTRVHLDYIIRRYCSNLGISFSEAQRKIKGYKNEVSSHLEAAKAIAEGRAEVGLMLRYAAETYKLKYIHYTWENYDFIVLKERKTKKILKTFLNEIKSHEFHRLINKLPGYRILT